MTDGFVLEGQEGPYVSRDAAAVRIACEYGRVMKAAILDVAVFGFVFDG